MYLIMVLKKNKKKNKKRIKKLFLIKKIYIYIGNNVFVFGYMFISMPLLQELKTYRILL